MSRYKKIFALFFLSMTALLFIYRHVIFASTSTYTNTKPLYLAHRGYSGIYPEGTSIAFLRAIESGADGLEFDLRQTKDGELVIAHNNNLENISDISIEIDKSTLTELQTIPLYQNQRILTLQDVINLSKKHNNIPIWPEIKESQKYPGIVDNFMQIIKNEGYTKNTIMQSFNVNDLNRAHSLNANIQLFKLTILGINNELKELPSFIKYVGIPIAVAYSNPSVIQEIHNKNKKIILWRESSLFENKYIIEYLAGLGADGFMINHPIHFLK